jgi:hypothetical protein
MRKLSLAVAVFGLLYGSGSAWAVLQETTIAITDNGRPIPSATVTLTPVEMPDPPRPKTAKTDDHGKIVLQHEEDAKNSKAPVDITIVTDSGKSITRRMNLIDLLRDTPIDVSVGECVYLNRLTDMQLKSLLDNRETRARIVKLIDKTASEEPRSSKMSKKRQQDTNAARKTEKGTADKRTRNQSDTEAPSPVHSQSGISPEAAGAVIGIGIGLGGLGRGGFGGGGGMQDGPSHMPARGAMPQRETVPRTGPQF